MKWLRIFFSFFALEIDVAVDLAWEKISCRIIRRSVGDPVAGRDVQFLALGTFSH